VTNVCTALDSHTELYMFVVAVIFLNLLVGIMTDSWSKVRD